MLVCIHVCMSSSHPCFIHGLTPLLHRNLPEWSGLFDKRMVVFIYIIRNFNRSPKLFFFFSFLQKTKERNSGRHSVFLWELKAIWLTQNLFWTNKCVNCGVHLPIHAYFQYRLLYKQLPMVVLLSGGLSLPTFWLRFLGVLTCLLFPGLQHGSECLLIPGLSSLSSLALGIAALSIRFHIKCFSLGRASMTIIQVSAFYFPQALCYTIYLYLKYSLAHAQALCFML